MTYSWDPPVATQDRRPVCRRRTTLLAPKLLKNAREARIYALIVEDSWAIAAAMQLTLEDVGYRTEFVADAKETFDAVKREKPALAIVDLRLRDGMTGPQIAQALAANNIPVIVATAEPDPGAVLRGVKVNRILGKPVRPETLLSSVRPFLRGN
jgi:CheY-like chemotaxis protein